MSMCGKIRKKKNHAGQILRMSASTLSSSKNPIGEYARRMKAKLGAKGGVVATAHKLARTLYIMIRDQKPYNKELIAKHSKISDQKRIKYYEKQIEKIRKAS